MKNKDEAYEQALLGKKIPILTLDNKWYKLFTKLPEESNIKELTQELNNLLKRQGKLNTESKEYKNLKKKLMNEIVTMVDEFEQSQEKKLASKIDETKRLYHVHSGRGSGAERDAAARGVRWRRRALLRRVRDHCQAAWPRHVFRSREAE